MSLDYELLIAGDTTAEDVAARGFPERDERPVGAGGLLSADLRERYGFSVTVNSDDQGYFDVVADDGRFEWEAERYVSLTFTMDNADRPDRMITMTAAVRRVLTTGSEDAVLIFTAGYLLLTRLDGEVRKYNRRDWWNFYPGMNDLIPDGK